MHSPIDDRRYDLLPVRTEMNVLLYEQLTLPGAIENQGVIPPRERCRSVPEKRLLGGTVIAPDRNDQRAASLINRTEIAGKRHTLKGNPHLIRRADHFGCRSSEGFALSPVRVTHQRGQRCFEMKYKGVAGIIRGAQESASRALAMAVRCARFCGGKRTISQ